jgi:hypothetical protein
LIAFAFASCVEPAPAKPHRSPQHAPQPVAPASRSTAADGGASAVADSDTSVLVINGETITIEQILKPLRKELTEKAASLTPARYQTYLRETLTRRIREEARDLLLHQQASRRLTDQEKQALEHFVDKEIRNRVNKNYGGRQTRYESALEAEGSSLSQERERIRREFIIVRYLHQTVGTQTAAPTRNDLWRFFEEQKSSLIKPERREMFLIEQKPDAAGRARIEQARAALTDGRPFEEVARDCSSDAHAAEGGAWGLITKDSVREKFVPAVEALFRLASGQTSGIIEAPDALFIVRCGAIEPQEKPDFEKLQPELVKRFNDFQFNVQVEELIGRLHAQAVIRPENINLFLQRVIDAAPKPTTAAIGPD